MSALLDVMCRHPYEREEDIVQVIVLTVCGANYFKLLPAVFGCTKHGCVFFAVTLSFPFFLIWNDLFYALHVHFLHHQLLILQVRVGGVENIGEGKGEKLFVGCNYFFFFGYYGLPLISLQTTMCFEIFMCKALPVSWIYLFATFSK